MEDKAFDNFFAELERMYKMDNEEVADTKEAEATPIVTKTISPVYDFTVGTDDKNEKITCDIISAPHVLVCGENTSKIIKNIVLELVKKDDFKLCLFGNTDFYGCFKNLPHLMHEVSFDDKRIEGALKYLLNEMENRFELFEATYTRNIREYTKKTSNDLPYIFVVIDDFDKLKLYNNNIIKYLTFLVQKSRAAGIHVIIGATNVTGSSLDGYIFNNVPTRIASKVKDKNASISAVFCSGAEKLEENKLMYFGTAYSFPKALNNPYFIDENEALNCIKGNFKKDENLDNFVSEYVKTIKEPSDILILSAKNVANKLDTFYATTFQKEMKIGYNKARLVLAKLERDGFICRDGLRSPYKIVKKLSYGQIKCNLLKSYRIRLAEVNKIDFKATMCDFEGECAGFCPACDEEILYLEKELKKKEKRGEQINLHGLIKLAFRNGEKVHPYGFDNDRILMGKIVDRKKDTDDDIITNDIEKAIEKLIISPDKNESNQKKLKITPVLGTIAAGPNKKSIKRTRDLLNKLKNNIEVTNDTNPTEDDDK